MSGPSPSIIDPLSLNGSVEHQGSSGEYRPADLWAYILGPKLPADSQWNGLELVKQVTASYDKCNRRHDNIPMPLSAFQEFWGYDIDRSKLPKVTPALIVPGLPNAAQKAKKQSAQMKVVEWFYPHHKNPRATFLAIRDNSYSLLAIITELAKIIPLSEIY